LFEKNISCPVVLRALFACEISVFANNKTPSLQENWGLEYFIGPSFQGYQVDNDSKYLHQLKNAIEIK
jgi:hypothetical protein